VKTPSVNEDQAAVSAPKGPYKLSSSAIILSLSHTFRFQFFCFFRVHFDLDPWAHRLNKTSTTATWLWPCLEAGLEVGWVAEGHLERGRTNLAARTQPQGPACEKSSIIRSGT